MEAVLRLEGISKSFESVSVLSGVDFEVQAGEVHALVGENGAGKSTLMKIAVGIHEPGSGRMMINGKSYFPRFPRDAVKSGIAMVHQELSLVPDVSVAENIFAGSESGRGLFVNWKRLNSEAANMLLEFGWNGRSIMSSIQREL